jgi:hypothetical protein
LGVILRPVEAISAHGNRQSMSSALAAERLPAMPGRFCASQTRGGPVDGKVRSGRA